MKLYYDDTGKIHYAVLNRDIGTFTHTTNIPLSTMEIDEIEDNRSLIVALIRGIRKVDHDGDPAPTHYVEDDLLKDAEGITIVPEVDTDREVIKAAYQQAITDLGLIQEATLDTAAKLSSAVKGLSEIVEKMLKYVARELVDGE